MHSFIICTLLAALLPANVTNSNGDLQTLEHYAGEWDTSMTIEAMDESGTDQHFTGTVNARWVLDNRFMEQTGSYRMGNSELVIKTLMTWDTDFDKFHYWYFISNGETQESTGTWEETTQVMTSTMKPNDRGDVTTITADFSKEGIETWVIETKNTEGRITGRITGTNTRR